MLIPRDQIDRAMSRGEYKTVVYHLRFLSRHFIVVCAIIGLCVSFCICRNKNNKKNQNIPKSITAFVQ